MVDTMVNRAPTRITRFGPNRHSVYLRSDLVNDSGFPFSLEDELLVRIEGKHLIIEATRQHLDHAVSATSRSRPVTEQET